VLLLLVDGTTESGPQSRDHRVALMSRPEHTAPPELFYDDKEAKKYTESSRIIHIQNHLTTRALELLALPEGQPLLLADIGCGSGLSGEVLEEHGHTWVGCDISQSMLAIANERENEGDLFALDMGTGLPYRPGTLDGAISISAVQWLCNADKTSHVPQRRLGLFFSSLYRALARGARAVFQFYPESPKQMELITTAAMKAGFAGGLVVDYPNSTKAKKYFLCLYSGPPSSFVVPSAKSHGMEEDDGDDEDEEDSGRIKVNGRERELMQRRRRKGKKGDITKKDWILQKKERRRKQGKDVKANSKYTGRKRKPRF
jgi:18S rRNA (guanine1575-N7)-methyltransferase